MILEEYHHTGYPVVEEGRLIGIVTLSDIQKLPLEKRGKVSVIEIVTRDITVTYQDEPVHSALDKMYEKDIGRLLVVDRDDPKRILGIISKHDILRAHEIAAERPAE